MGQKNTFSDHFFSEEALSEEQLIRKSGKTEEEVTKRKVIRKIVSSDTKASPGRIDAKVKIFLQTQTSCRFETSVDDYVAAVTVAVAAYRPRKQRIKTISWHWFWSCSTRKMQSCPENKSVAFATYVVQQFTSSVYIIRCRWRPLAQQCLHGTLRPSSFVRVVVQARND